MKLRNTILVVALVIGGCCLSANKASAQVWINPGFNNPYAVGWGNPYMNSTPMYGYWANPYWSSPYGALGTGSPYWFGRTYTYSNPFFGTGFNNFYYVNPGWGPGAYSYRFGRWGW